MIKHWALLRAPGSFRTDLCSGPVFALTTPSKASIVLHPDHPANDSHSEAPLTNPRTQRTQNHRVARAPAQHPAGRPRTPHSPDGGRFGSLHLQVIRLVVHLELGEHQRDGVSRVGEDGPLALPVPGAGGADGAHPGGVGPAQEVGAGDEAAGATQGAAAGVLRCQSTDQKGQRGSGCCVRTT